ncbi:MAG TPA: hypothetical protein VF103_05650 [Polyangiaceae bacterium]
MLLFAVALAVGCGRGEAPGRAVPRPKAVEAGPFVCAGETCTQRHPRLPDDGEWRCAERDGVVWCAGGEPAAGVVALSASRGYRCGERRGASRKERVCVDPAPDYPPGGPVAFRCRFDEERGGKRTCSKAEGVSRALLPGAEPNCWVDKDCPGRCERGTCSEGG